MHGVEVNGCFHQIQVGGHASVHVDVFHSVQVVVGIHEFEERLQVDTEFFVRD